MALRRSQVKQISVLNWLIRMNKKDVHKILRKELFFRKFLSIFLLILTQVYPNLILTRELTQTLIVNLKKQIKNVWITISHFRCILLNLKNFVEIVIRPSQIFGGLISHWG